MEAEVGVEVKGEATYGGGGRNTESIVVGNAVRAGSSRQGSATVKCPYFTRQLLDKNL